MSSDIFSRSYPQRPRRLQETGKPEVVSFKPFPVLSLFSAALSMARGEENGAVHRQNHSVYPSGRGD